MNNRSHPRATLLIVVTLLIDGCMGYVPGRQSYWDSQVKDLCRKDAGVTVYERVALTPSEYRLLKGSGADVSIPSDRVAPSAAYVRQTERTFIRDANPTVSRYETRIVRQSDGKVLSRSITYSRVGGDFPSPAHESVFSCRDMGFRESIERETFVIPQG